MTDHIGDIERLILNFRSTGLASSDMRIYHFVMNVDSAIQKIKQEQNEMLQTIRTIREDIRQARRKMNQ